MMLRYVTVVAALYVGTVASIHPASATEGQHHIAVTASQGVRISDTDLNSLKEKIQETLPRSTSNHLRVTVDSVAIRPGGTPATLRQLGGHDAIRLTVSNAGKEESVLVTSRTEGLSDQSLGSRRGKLFAAAATVVSKRTL